MPKEPKESTERTKQKKVRPGFGPSTGQPRRGSFTQRHGEFEHRPKDDPGLRREEGKTEEDQDEKKAA